MWCIWRQRHKTYLSKIFPHVFSNRLHQTYNKDSYQSNYYIPKTIQTLLVKEETYDPIWNNLWHILKMTCQIVYISNHNTHPVIFLFCKWMRKHKKQRWSHIVLILMFSGFFNLPQKTWDLHATMTRIFLGNNSTTWMKAQPTWPKVYKSKLLLEAHKNLGTKDFTSHLPWM